MIEKIKADNLYIALLDVVPAKRKVRTPAAMIPAQCRTYYTVCREFKLPFAEEEKLS